MNGSVNAFANSIPTVCLSNPIIVMKISFNTSAIQPMIDWLLERKRTGQGDEVTLRRILSLPDYAVEFARYGLRSLPVCGITFEEAVDFFLHFDDKDFENQRLQYKKESFVRFYEDIENRLSSIHAFLSLTEGDCALIERLLKNALPDEALKDIPELNIILIVSIGNSMGWPHDHYIDYDLANLDAFKTKDDFLHVTAHEIHHIFVGQMLGGEGVSSEGFFLQNFAYEGLAVHFMNNQGTIGKPKKYDAPTYCMDESDMAFYEERFDEIFSMIQDDYRFCKGKTLEEVADLISAHYEQFSFMGKSIKQYPTYYFGCYLWGIIDLRYGKEKLFETIADPTLFVKLYNEVASHKYRLDECE